MENSLTASLQVKHKCTIWPGNTPTYLHKINENTYEDKESHVSVNSSIFTLAPNSKQPKCSLADEWINKIWSICTMEYYSADKKECYNMDESKNIMLSERSQTQRPQIVWFSLYELSRKGKCVETENRLVAAWVGCRNGDYLKMTLLDLFF